MISCDKKYSTEYERYLIVFFIKIEERLCPLVINCNVNIQIIDGEICLAILFEFSSLNSNAFVKEIFLSIYVLELCNTYNTMIS